MKNQSLLSPLPHLDRDLLRRDLRQKPALSQVRSRQLRENIADVSPLKCGKGFEGIAVGKGDADVDSSLPSHSARWDHDGATNPEENEQKLTRAQNKVAEGPQKGHKSPMPKADKPRTSADPHQSKRHKFYGDAALVDALDQLCESEGRSRSEIVMRLVKAYLRTKAKKMREAGIKMPAAAITK
jgi:hypothetical protein